MEVVKAVGKYLNTPIGTLCYNTDKVLTTVLDKENIEGVASIILRLAMKTDIAMTQEQILLSYQWLEHMAMYVNQAITNPTFAKCFLQGINRALAKDAFLTGSTLTVADIAAYHVLYPLLDNLSINELETFLHVCRWFKHVQAMPRILFNYVFEFLLIYSNIYQATKGSVIKLPKQILPHELKNISLERPFVYHPQPFSYPGYPVILYL